MNRVVKALGRRLRLGVVGGGPGSFIGPVHRTAARIDDCFEVAAAVLSSDPDRSRAAAGDIGITPDRAYADWRVMLETERERDDGIDVVAVMTPNHLHYPVAEAALEKGFDIVCDKPLTTTTEEAVQLARKARAEDRIFCVTFNYSQYPMVRQARALVKKGIIGEVRQIHLAYVQGHNASLVEAGPKKGDWRFDPAKAGESLILGDIGSHAHHLGSYVSGLELTEVLAERGPTVPGRAVDDYAALLLRWSNGARGTMWVTNAAAGAEHGLAFRVFGAEGGFEWDQEQPNHLLHRRLDGFPELQTRRLHGALEPEAEHATRVEIGHPEGFQEAFANLYRDVAWAIAARRTGMACDPLAQDFPTVLDGARGMRFIEAAIESSRTGAWTDCRLDLEPRGAPGTNA